MPSSLRYLLRPLSLLAVGSALLLGALVVGETFQLVRRAGEWGTPMQEVGLVALGLMAAGGGWLLWREGGGYLRLRRVGKLKRALKGEGRASQSLLEGVQRWLNELDRVHGEPLADALHRTRSALVGQEHVAPVRRTIEVHLLPALDERTEKEIRSSALRLGVASSFFSMALLDGVLTLWFSVRLVRRVAELHGGRPGLVGTAQLLREVSMAAIGADLSQHAADALSTRVGSLAAAAGQGLVTATLLVRVGLWAQSVCRPIEVARSSVGAFVVRGAAHQIRKGMRGGVHRAMGALRSESRAQI
ncbi:MAG TPA: DUF697 domain-containing protein [Planctomycetes bacterium]|nr:DUF697 domain-containing protein [Planctomycetota bacterium]HIK61636.1 DUF697 domain-containing protein [Planctomycetota bacterium]